MLFKWEIEALGWREFKSIELGPLTIWNIFHYFFRNFLHGDTDEKVDLGNKEKCDELNVRGSPIQISVHRVFAESS